jgi:DNA-binding transcriptional ArsR family regulator
MGNRVATGSDLDETFGALAHPIRRAIIEQLATQDSSVGDLAEPHKVSLPAISKHLRVLEDAGLVTVEPEGRVRRVQLEARPLSEAFGWLTRYRILWEDRLDRLAEHLKRENRSRKRRM